MRPLAQEAALYRLKAALWKGRSLLQHEVRANVGFGSFATNQYAALSGRMSASPPIATELMQRREPTRCANCGLVHCNERRKKIGLFDHLVGAADQRQRNGKAEGLGSLQVDDQLDFGSLLDRQIGRLLTLENLGGVATGQTVRFRNIT